MTAPSKKKPKAYIRKTDNELRGRPPLPKDEVTSVLLATGEATIAQIAQLFETDAKTLPKRLKRLIPTGMRSGYKVFKIREAAAYLVAPGYEIEEFIRQMSPQELPSLLLKEFWNGQRARLEYEKSLGNLWETPAVVEAFGEVLGVVRMTLLLFADDVDREDSLSDGQRAIIRRMTDALIVTLGENISEKFKDYHANLAASGTEDEDEPEPDDTIVEGFDDPLTVEDEDDLRVDVLEAEDDEEEDIEI